MRRRKHKNVRRAVRFFKVLHGFREPYKVLLDGNFVHVMREMAAGDPREKIPQLLGAKCRCFVTK
jgi:U3 small nucleolar RNA-associated protein 23